EVILAAVHGEPQGERPVKHVGFGKAEEQDPGKTAYAGLNGKRFAQAQEVVGLVIQSDERAFQTAHASSKPDAVLAFLLDLDRQIHGGVLLVNLALRVLFGLQGLEVVELVEAQHAHIPQLGIEDLALLHQQLAPDHAVASGGVALELDASYGKRLA